MKYSIAASDVLNDLKKLLDCSTEEEISKWECKSFEKDASGGFVAVWRKNNYTCKERWGRDSLLTYDLCTLWYTAEGKYLANRKETLLHMLPGCY